MWLDNFLSESSFRIDKDLNCVLLVSLCIAQFTIFVTDYLARDHSSIMLASQWLYLLLIHVAAQFNGEVSLVPISAECIVVMQSKLLNCW